MENQCFEVGIVIIVVIYGLWVGTGHHSQLPSLLLPRYFTKISEEIISGWGRGFITDSLQVCIAGKQEDGIATHG